MVTKVDKIPNFGIPPSTQKAGMVHTSSGKGTCFPKQSARSLLSALIQPNTGHLPDFIIFAHMPRILAFDYGTKRIGLAVTDPLQIIATGLDTIHPKDAIEYLKKYLLAEQVEAFVFGDPKQMDGSPSDSAQHVKGFARTLKRTFPDIPQHWVDERFTSKLAHQTIMQSGLKKTDRQNKERVDTISATIILQYFMEQHRL